MEFAGRRPIENGWFICLALGLGVCLFREMRENRFTWITKRIAQYSYGIYLLHYFAIWLAFAVCRGLNLGLRIAIFFTALTTLSALVYHSVEAPLIAVGMKLSERFKECRTGTVRLNHPGADAAAAPTPAGAIPL